MKIGSIVECVNANMDVAGLAPQLKLKTPYTVSWIGIGWKIDMKGNSQNERCHLLMLEEVNSGEYAYMVHDFRELLPPMEIQKELDECIPVEVELHGGVTRVLWI